jgi:hypothetical protein
VWRKLKYKYFSLFAVTFWTQNAVLHGLSSEFLARSECVKFKKSEIMRVDTYVYGPTKPSGIYAIAQKVTHTASV